MIFTTFRQKEGDQCSIAIPLTVTNIVDIVFVEHPLDIVLPTGFAGRRIRLTLHGAADTVLALLRKRVSWLSITTQSVKPENVEYRVDIRGTDLLALV